MNTHTVAQFPEEKAPFAIARPGEMDEPARLLEVRTPSGTFYVCPSTWQRLRLLWIFRHFHVLPQQVLSRRDQRLIEKLSRSAVVKQDLPVARNAILGVVEKPRTNLTGPAAQVVTMGKQRRAPQTLPMSLLVPGLPTPGQHQRLLFEKPAQVRKPTNPPPARVPGFRQWNALGVLIAVCLVVILVRFSLPARTIPISKTPSAPVAQTAKRALPPAVPVNQKPKHRPSLPPSPGGTTVARRDPPLTRPPQPFVIRPTTADVLAKPLLIGSPTPAQRLFVSELPQGHFAAPIIADPNQVGELHLRALIAADGSVKDVRMVSGNPKLAAAGMRAVPSLALQSL